MKAQDFTPWIDEPLAITPGALGAIAALERGFLEAAGEVRANIQAAMDAPGRPAGDGLIAVIPLWGAIAQRGDLFMALFGGTNLQAVAGRFRAAMAEPAVKAIVFDVSSPGGAVYGVPEFAREVREARGSKPIVAVANSKMASAAYWIASAADRIVATPSAELGSIGVYLMHLDRSKADELAGESYTVVSAGDLKTDATGHEPLSDEGKDAMQALVDDFYGMFVGDVAKGRGVSPDVVRKSYGRGATMSAAAAKAAGMVDRVATLDDVLRQLTTPSGRTGILRAEGEQLEDPPAPAPELEPAANDLGELELRRRKVRRLGA